MLHPQLISQWRRSFDDGPDSVDSSELEMLKVANEKTGPIIRLAMKKGPNALCLLHAASQ